jgi:hypothetical protein
VIRKDRTVDGSGPGDRDPLLTRSAVEASVAVHPVDQDVIMTLTVKFVLK